MTISSVSPSKRSMLVQSAEKKQAQKNCNRFLQRRNYDLPSANPKLQTALFQQINRSSLISRSSEPAVLRKQKQTKISPHIHVQEDHISTLEGQKESGRLESIRGGKTALCRESVAANEGN